MAQSGWYSDPTGEHVHRWFDGSSWTDHVRDGDLDEHPGGDAAVDGPARQNDAGADAAAERTSADESELTVLKRELAPQATVVHPAGDPPLTHQDIAAQQLLAAPAPIKGWGLLVLFAALLVASFVLPFASAGGSSAEPLSTDLQELAPVLVLSGGALVAGLAGRAGYDVGPALGGGVVLVFSVVLALVAPIVKLLIDLGSALGSSFQPNVGLVCLVAAGVVGLMVGVPAFRAALQATEGQQVPLLVGLLAAGGTGLYVWGATRPAYEGAPLLVGDWWIDSALVTLLAVIVLPGLLVLIVRSAASAALLGGVLLFPAVSWFIGAMSEGSGFAVSRPAGFEQMGYGLLVALPAAAAGVFGYAQRSIHTSEGLQRVPAKSTGAAAVVIAVIAVVGFVAMEEDRSGEPSGFSSDADEIFTGDGAPPECLDAWAYGYAAPIYCEEYG